MIPKERDIIESKYSELLLYGEFRILSLIATHAPLSEILNAIVESIESISQETLSSILILDQDGLHLRHGAAPHLPAAYNCVIDGAAIGPRAGSCGTAAYRREPVIVTDIETDLLWDDYREIARAHGLRACWSTPILDSAGSVLGTFAMYYREPRSPQAEDFHLIQRASHLASVAIERHQAEEKIVASEQRLRSLFAAMSDIVWVLDHEGRYLQIAPTNPDCRHWPANRLRGKTIHEVLPTEGAAAIQRHIDQALQTRQSVQVEYSLPLDDRQAWFYATVSPLTDGQVICISRDISQRKQAEEELREAQELSEQIFASTQHGLIVLDRDLRYRMWNPVMEQITGVAAAQVLGRQPQEVLPSLEQAGVIDAMRRALAGEIVQLGDIEYERPGNGGPGWCTAILGPIRNSKREIIGVINSVVEITARRLVENENQKLMHALGERVKELMCLHRTASILQKNELSVADWLREIVRIAPQGWQYPEVTAVRIVLGDLEFASTGFRCTPWLQRAEFVGASGTKGFIEVVYLEEKPAEVEGPFLAEERNLINSLTEMLCSAINHRKAEDALHANKERLIEEKRFIDTLMDSLPGIVYLFDANGRFLKWNKVLEQASGFSSAEVAALRPLDLLSAEGPESISTSIELVFSEGQHSVEGHLLTKDRRRIPYYFKGVRLHTEQGPCLLGIGMDISDRRRLEDQFRQAQKMEAIGHLAAGVAHDFNNLLTVISGYCELMLSKPAAGEADLEALKAIRDAGERAASLTRQLLAFSRQSVLQPKVLELNAVVLETEKLLRRMIGEDIALEVILDPDTRRIKADPGHLSQVLINLSVNARDAMPKGGKLTIATCSARIDRDYCLSHPTARPGEYASLTVTDSGCGMTPEIQAQIFEPFFTTKGVGKGTGLGLAMVYGIIEQSGGYIEVNSEVGRGTTFRLYFPAVDEQLTHRIDRSRIPSLNCGNETVLLLEDDDGVRGFATSALQFHGYNVLAAVNGKDALRLASEEKVIDILVTDVVMPGLSGPEVANALRARFPRMRVLYVSGYTDDAIVRHGFLHEEIEFLQKPYTPVTLAKKVRDVLDAARK